MFLLLSRISSNNINFGKTNSSCEIIQHRWSCPQTQTTSFPMVSNLLLPRFSHNLTHHWRCLSSSTYQPRSTIFYWLQETTTETEPRSWLAKWSPLLWWAVEQRESPGPNHFRSSTSKTCLCRHDRSIQHPVPEERDWLKKTIPQATRGLRIA